MHPQDDKRRRETEELTAAILAATSGSPCARAEALLPCLADGDLSEEEVALLTAHLAHCAPCRALAQSLAWLERTLPALATCEPDARFTADVLAALADADATAALPRLDERLAEWWRRSWRRPRFALEAAYAGTLLVVALTATPVSPLREAPREALALLRGEPSSLAAALPLDLTRVTDSLAGAGDAAVDSGARALRAAQQGLGERLADWRQRLQPQLRELWRDLGALVDSLRRRDLAAASSNLSEVLGDLKRIGRSGQPAPAPTTTMTQDAAPGGRT
ncbi:zf-HC2 domain-containing protein [bacterium]|nr:zf-HC2 domain-containing protein [bacterium]